MTAALMVGRDRGRRWNTIVFAAVAVVALSGGALVLSNQRTREVVPVLRDTAATIAKPTGSTVSWRPDAWKPESARAAAASAGKAGPARSVRMFDESTRNVIEATYLRAWKVLGGVEGSRAASDVLVGPALANALSSSPSTVFLPPTSLPMHSESLGHDLELRFYSAAGNVVGVREHHARTLRTVSTPDGARQQLITDEQFDLVFTLEQDTWKLRHVRRIGGTAHGTSDGTSGSVQKMNSSSTSN